MFGGRQMWTKTWWTKTLFTALSLLAWVVFLQRRQTFVTHPLFLRPCFFLCCFGRSLFVATRSLLRFYSSCSPIPELFFCWCVLFQVCHFLATPSFLLHLLFLGSWMFFSHSCFLTPPVPGCTNRFGCGMCQPSGASFFDGRVHLRKKLKACENITANKYVIGCFKYVI